MKNIICVMICLLSLGCFANAQEPSAITQEPSTITQDELVRREQALYDAVGTADNSLWEKYFADDAIYFDEKGRWMDKKALIADLSPFPAGYSGTIKVKDAKVVLAAGVAILSFNQDETETIFGQNLQARYHVTDTWLYRSGRWQIAASQVLRYYEDPAAGPPVAEKTLADYAGVYELSPGNQITITVTGKELFAQRGTGKTVKLLPESPDLFFRPGVEGRRLFLRDASGKVSTLVDRRNNEDVIWKKVR